MSPIPIYLKIDENMPRPSDSEYYLVAREGTYICRNHDWFISDVPTSREPAALAEHGAACMVSYPKIPARIMEYCVGFFGEVYERHGSEAIVILLWDLDEKKYRIHIPRQQPTVWESSRGTRSALDVTYKTPIGLPGNLMTVGSIHSHADMSPVPSYTDKSDETNRDGIHIIVGHVDREPPDFHFEIVVDGFRFRLRFDQILEDYQERAAVPESWMQKVDVIVQKSTWGNSSINTCDTTCNYGKGGYYDNGNYGCDGNMA